MFCVKLIDNTGNEHLILVLDKYAKIEVEDGSRIVKYESDGKASILFGNDKLREADYDIDGPKVVGIDCTTRRSFITDLDMFDLLYKKECGVNDKVHFIFIVAENVKVSINGITRFVNYTDNDGMNGVVFGSDTYNLANFTNDNVDMHVGIDCTTAESFIIDSDLFNSLEKRSCTF